FTSVVNGKLVVSQNAQADVSFSADASDLLMIAARKQDPDTLFDLQWFTSVVNGKLVVSQNAQADVSFSADASDLLMIAARKQDPDTLFFQRRLVIEGDTELGLYVKNLMDAIELEQMPKALRMMLLQLADFVEAGMKTAPETKQTSVGEPC
ncbi:ubiquinone anaerobic biosynthesis accessory factor UbiT, partial [Escherichia coli]|uniref:ubiquinone anaerobic biosynthesis accessory factor UbiT n=1 Tax=Escherichia coli TaxID=562 RepID=UPI002023AB54